MSESNQMPAYDTASLTAELVSAYVSNNNVPGADLPLLIAGVHRALLGLVGKPGTELVSAPKATPGQIRRSVSPDVLISFEDGKGYKTLGRHLTLRGLTPMEYRVKWGLPLDYPMTTTNYSAQRSALAHSLGLGRQRKTKVADPAAVVAEPVARPAEARHGRQRKTEKAVASD